MIYQNDDILKDADLAQAEWYIDHKPFKFGWKSDLDIPYGHWNLDLTGTAVTSSEDVAWKLSDEIGSLWEMINAKVFDGKAVVTRCYANRHTFGTEGFIHTDTTREQDHTVVVYLNKDWDANWGGETVFYSEDRKAIVSAVLPAYGRIAVFPGKVPHRVSSLTKLCPEARTTLMFKVSIDPKALTPDEERLIDFLKKHGTDKIPHRVGTLYDHLMRVYHILHSMGAPSYLALAGGLHSIYGTNTFKDNPVVQKADVLNEFGPEVYNLVRQFSTINRPECLENMDPNISDQDMFDLRCIECANLYDQSELNERDYPNLFKFAKEARKVLKA